MSQNDKECYSIFQKYCFIVPFRISIQSPQAMWRTSFYQLCLMPLVKNFLSYLPAWLDWVLYPFHQVHHKIRLHLLCQQIIDLVRFRGIFHKYHQQSYQWLFYLCLSLALQQCLRFISSFFSCLQTQGEHPFEEHRLHRFDPLVIAFFLYKSV